MSTEPRAGAETQRVTMPFSFGGNASEYFGIWIVNLLLTVVTLGIYSAWAKVRRLRYFYGNTWLDGHNFEYHAKPLQILIGRIIVLVIIIVVTAINSFFPLYAYLLIVPYLLVLPWLINQSMRFNARMTSYRNVRLGFSGTFLRSMWVFVILPTTALLVAAAIIGLIILSGVEWQDYPTSDGGTMTLPTAEYLYVFGSIFGAALLVQLAIIPFISRASNEYIGNNLSFGAAEFATEMKLGSLYKNFGLILLCTLLPFLIVGLLILLAYLGGGAEGAMSAVAGFGTILIFVFYILLLIAPIAYAAGVRNIAFSGTVLDGKHRMLSFLSRKRYAWIILSNLFLISITFGLMRPWAACRTWNYLAENTAIQVDGTMDGIIAAQEGKGNVVAAEYLDIEGIEIGL